MANFLKLFKKKDGTPPARQTPSASGSGTGVPPSGSRRSSNASKGSSAVASGTGSKAGSKAGTPAGTPAPELPQSEFARSAHEAARRGLREPPREIDENTALSSLTDAEIMRLMEGMEDNVLSQPLITGPVPIIAIRKEYLSGSKQVLRKVEWLQENGWDQVWRARGDGDCFYRSFTLAYLLRILYAPSSSEAAAQALSAVHATLPSMEGAGFQSDLLDEFLEPLLSVLASFIDPRPGQEITEYNLLEVLQDTEKSNCIVVALRLITGAHIRTHPDDFAPFLFSPTTLEPMTPDAFCAAEVEPCGREADNAQIMALAAALHVPIRVAYLDRSEAGDGVINWVEFEDAAEANRPLTLLYRPGHFDVVAKDKLHDVLAAHQEQERANVAGPSGTSREPEPEPVAGPSGTSSEEMPVVGPSGTTSDKGHQVFQPVQVTSNQSSPTPGVLSKQASPERSFEPESESEVVPEAVSALHASQLLSELTPEPVVEREAEPVIAPVPLVPLSEPAVPSAAVADEPLAYPAGSTLENTSTPSAFPSVTAAPVGTSDLASPSGIPPSEEAVATSILSALTTEPELTVPAPASSDAPSLPPLNLATSTLTPESGLTSPFDRETAVPFLQPRGRSLPPAEDDDEKKTAGTP